ncbi:MAG: helix-turn-helix transcriptional regulator [Bacteroidota bacterium]
MSIYQEEILNGFSGDPSIGHKIRRIRNQALFKQVKQVQFDRLTIRERQIIQLLARDYNSPQIARLLSISRATVAQHRKNINRKLGISSFGQLYYYALAFDLV